MKVGSMTIRMEKRQAQIDALNVVLALIQKEQDSPSGFLDIAGNVLRENPLYVEALQNIAERIEGERDTAAHKLYKIADRKAYKQEMREALRNNRLNKRK